MRALVRRGLVALAPMLLAVSLAAPAAAEPPLSRTQALLALTHEQAPERGAAVARLAEVGLMADAARVAERLRDDDEGVRELAGAALWMIWSRSGDAAIDKLFARGVGEMGAGQLSQALATFTRIVKRKPDFAEGWNQRATVLFLMGRDEASLKDCEQVLKRNPIHFGVLSGMAQIHLAHSVDPAKFNEYRNMLPNLGKQMQDAAQAAQAGDIPKAVDLGSEAQAKATEISQVIGASPAQ